MSENQHSTDANSRYIRMFNRFFEKGKMAGTYKAVFLRALTDIGKYHRDDLIGKQWIHHDGDEVQLDLDFIASRLAKYYWDMEIAFGMRHMPERMADADEPTHSFFLWQHEPCFVGWVQSKMPKRKPPSDVSTVWNVDQRFEQMGVHPTQKPVELFIRPIEYHTEPGEIVYEPFSGSGTQIIAAERTGRVCYAVEQEPSYVDVAVKRWEAFTGLEATRESAGEQVC